MKNKPNREAEIWKAARKMQRLNYQMQALKDE